MTATSIRRPGAGASASQATLLLAASSLAFWLYYAFLRQVAGPLNPDEVYFAHTLWLVNQGKQQYVDFYNNHLPTYFQLLRPLVAAMSGSSTDLSYVWGIRALSAVIIGVYLALAWLLRRDATPGAGRAGLLGMSALLLVFVVLGRMVEVRADTIGLLLVNMGWAIVLRARTTRTMAAAAMLAGLSILFSARAAGMAGVMGLLMLYLAGRARGWAGIGALLCVAGSFLAAALALYLAAPEWVALVIRSCFIEPSKLLAGIPLVDRLFAADRLPLTVLILGGLLAGVHMAWRERTEQGLVIAVACGAQLLMVVLDPAPHQYVYGWAAVPAVLGLVHASLPLAVYFSFFLGAAIVAASIGYGVMKGEAPRTSSYFRLTFDATLSMREIAALPTPALVALLVSDERQKNLASQLRVRSEVCRRLHGRTLASFDTHPICLDDAMFYGTGVRWPPLAEGDAPRRDAMSQEEFGRILLAAQPSVIIWAHRWAAPGALLPAARQMLACCYEIHDGFAVSRETAAGGSGTRGGEKPSRRRPGRQDNGA